MEIPRIDLHWDTNLTQPILALEAIDPSKFALVLGHKNMPERNRLGSDEQIVRGDRFAALFKTSS